MPRSKTAKLRDKMKDIRTAIKKADTKHVLKIGKMRHKIVLLREEYDGLKQGKKKV